MKMSLNVNKFELILKNELFLKKQHKIIMMLQERISKLINMETETLDISLLKPSADSPIQQINEFLYDPEEDQIFGNWFDKCKDNFQKDLARRGI